MWKDPPTSCTHLLYRWIVMFKEENSLSLSLSVGFLFQSSRLFWARRTERTPSTVLKVWLSVSASPAMSISWPRQTILDLLSIPISLGTVWQQTSSLTPQTRGYFNSQYKELHLHQHDRASESDSRFLLKSVIMSWAKMSQKALFNSTANLSMPVTGPAYIAVQRVAPQSQRDVEPPQKTKSSFSYQARLCQFLSWLREQRMDLLTKPKKEGTRCIHFCDVLDSELDQNTLYFRIQQIG